MIDQGNAWHYRWFVPYDPTGFMDFYGVLCLSFTDPYYSNIVPNPYYCPGIEEDLFSVYMFPYPPVSRQDLTAYYTCKILEYYYPNKPLGIPGQDDYGTMSAWAIWAYLGFGPRTGDGQYIIGSPYFNNITMHRNDRYDINIIVNNITNAKYYKLHFLISQILRTVQ